MTFVLEDPSQFFGVHTIAAVDKNVKMDDYGAPCKESVKQTCQAYMLDVDFVEEVYWTLQSRKPSKILSAFANDLIFNVYLRDLAADEVALIGGATFLSVFSWSEFLEISTELELCVRNAILAGGTGDCLSPTNIETVKQYILQKASDDVADASYETTHVIKKEPAPKPSGRFSLIRLFQALFMGFATFVFLYWWSNQKAPYDSSLVGVSGLLYKTTPGSHPNKSDGVEHGCLNYTCDAFFAVADSLYFDGHINVADGLFEHLN